MEIAHWPDEAGVPQAPEVALARRVKAREFAQLYQVFVDDERGRRLLAAWHQTLEDRTVNPAASHAEYAYYEAQRAFVRGIQRQIALSQTEDLQ